MRICAMLLVGDLNDDMLTKLNLTE